ncbi:MAG: hydrogenase maturation protease, partial [Wenzhouxiangellaceae bacterium]
VEQTEYLIVADAAQFHTEPGTVRLLEQAEMDAYLGSGVRPSVHEVNLLDVLTAARLRGSMPPRYALVGIQPQHIGWSTRPSETVAPSVRRAADIIESLIAGVLEPAGAGEPSG